MKVRPRIDLTQNSMRGRPAELPLVREGTLARPQSGLQPACIKLSRWQAVVGPAVAGLGILFFIGYALSM